MRTLLEWLWPSPPSLDAALWGRMPRALAEWLLVTYVAPHNCRAVRLCNRRLRHMCTPVYERLREEQLRWYLSVTLSLTAPISTHVFKAGDPIKLIGGLRDFLWHTEERTFVRLGRPEKEYVIIGLRWRNGDRTQVSLLVARRK